MEKLLEVKNLVVSYFTYAGEVQSVRNVSFDIEKGKTTAIVGESGCGKTVTAKTLMGLIHKPGKIKEGSQIIFEGKDLTDFTTKEWNEYRGKKSTMIFQDALVSLNPTMKIGKQIMESLILHRGLNKKQAREEAIHMLELVRIPDAAKRVDAYPHQLSGGMRQRVMIAIALSCNPSLLIADEPTTALDVTIQSQIMELLGDLKKELNTAIILVTHDLGVVADFADRIQVMYAGQVIERGTAREIFYDAKHPYTWALLSSVPRLDTENKQELYALKGTPPDLLMKMERCPFAARCEYCMGICKEAMPEETDVTGTHKVSCWLQHPDAPQVKSFYDKQKESKQNEEV